MKKPCILIVEDEPIVGLALQDTVEALGYEVGAIVDSADLVLEAFRVLKPDLIIMDIRLRSFTDGIDAAKRLRLFTQIPIIFLTANASPDTKARAEKASPIAFLTKPCDDKLLAEHIATFLQSA